MATTKKSKTRPCFFLDMLPAELRLKIYKRLVVSHVPLQGPTARGREEYGLHLSILRVNKKIYGEACTVFLGKNIFKITTCVLGEEEIQEEEAPSGTPPFDPPLLPHHLPLVRHLDMDLLPQTQTVPVQNKYLPGEKAKDLVSLLDEWRSANRTYLAYVSYLTTLLQKTNLHSLSLTATPPTPFDAKATLLTFISLERSPFVKALASLPSTLTSIPVAFEFEYFYYKTCIAPQAFAEKSILTLACQVLFCQSQARIQRMMAEFEEDGNAAGDCDGKIDLGPVMQMCVAQMPGIGELLRRAEEV